MKSVSDSPLNSRLSIQPAQGGWRLECEQIIDSPLDRVFAFFSDATNLQRITPDTVGFQILTPPPIEMRAGTRIDYALRIAGVPVRWRTLITRWEPGVRFTDEQESGPYAFWRHTHEFEALGSRTRMRDVVDYAPPFGPLGSIAHALFIRRMLTRIFTHRRETIESLFSSRSED